MADRIQLRRDTAANWTAYNPILLEGEPGIEIDTDQWKLGDGVHTWSQLAYRGGECVQQRGQSTTVAMSQKAVTDELNLIGVFDISAHNLTNGQPTKYADLTAALGTNGANVPEQYRVPGMTVKYVQSSDNKYAQYRYMSSSTAAATFTNVANWQGVDDKPTPGSHNLIESGVVADKFNQIYVDSVGLDTTITKNVTTTRALVKFLDVNIKSGTKFKATVSGTAVWSRLWIACNNDSTIRLQDFVVSDTEYTITAPVDITSIELELYTVTTAGSVILNIVTENKVKEYFSQIAEKTINLFDINAPVGQESRFDGYLGGTPIGYKSNANYKMTPYIEVTEGLEYVASTDGIQYGMRFVYFYTDKSLDALVSSVTSMTMKATVPTGLGIKYARFVFAMQEWNEKLMVEQSSTVHAFVHYGYGVRNDSLDASFIGGLSRQYNNILGSIKGANAQLDAGSVLTLPVTHVHKYFCLNARVHGAFNNIYVGVGRNARYGYWVELTASQAIVHFYYNSDTIIQTENHGLTIGEDTSVTIFSGNNNAGQAKIIIVSNGSQYSFNVTNTFTAGGAGFLRNNNTSGSINIELTFTAQKINSPVWIFGDSYTYPDVDRTWTKWLIEWSGEEPWLGNQQPGIDSVSSYTDLLNLLQIGKPRYLVWCLGMNGGSDVDSTTPNVAWKEAVDNVMSLCQNYGITLILATIPNVPTINHEAKNAYVKASGYRYIDFAKAVGAETFIEGVSTWYGEGTDYDYLESATPRIHASAFGGKALADQVLQDFPEIICLNS